MTKKLSNIDQIIAMYQGDQSALIQMLLEIQRENRWLPKPALSTIRYFKDEYEAHIRERRCPAGVCKALVSYYINPEQCQAFQICLRECPGGGRSREVKTSCMLLTRISAPNAGHASMYVHHVSLR